MADPVPAFVSLDSGHAVAQTAAYLHCPAVDDDDRHVHHMDDNPVAVAGGGADDVLG